MIVELSLNNSLIIVVAIKVLVLTMKEVPQFCKYLHLIDMNNILPQSQEVSGIMKDIGSTRLKLINYDFMKLVMKIIFILIKNFYLETFGLTDL